MPRVPRRIVPFLLLLLAGAPAVDASVLQATSWNRTGGRAGAQFGASVAPAGDVNGDGYGDLLVGAPGYDLGAAGGGAAFVYHGGASGIGASPNSTYLGTQAGMAAGTCVAPAGDVNGDGYDDVLIGSPLFDGAQGADQGRVSLVLGSATGLVLPAAQNFDGPAAGARFGFSAASAGDVDADGYADVVVGAPRHTSAFATEGSVTLYRGTAGGLVVAGWTKFGGAADAQFGYSVSGAGDADADGYDDVVLGAPGVSGAFVAAGRVVLYRGGIAGLAAAPATTLAGGSDSSAFGASVALAGDVDADGYADVLIGEPKRSGNAANAGRVHLYRGTQSGLGSRILQPAGSQVGENFGVCVATAGDIDGDGHADFLFGADRWPTAAERRGRVFVYVKGQNVPEIDVERQGTVNGQALGLSVATAGDLDGDGFSDVVLGEPGVTAAFSNEGRVTILRGSARLPVAMQGWPVVGPAGEEFGAGVAGGIDAFGTGANDLHVGSPLHEGTILGFTGKVEVAPYTYPLTALVGPPVIMDKAPLFLGERLARAGDVNGDGYEDILVGAPRFGFGRGLALLHLGSAIGFTFGADWSIQQTVDGEVVGRVLAGGDFNSDGYADALVTGAPGGPNDLGRAEAYYGSPSGLPLEPSWTVIGVKDTGTGFGSAAATGDWDADGFTDVAIGAFFATNGQETEGRVTVYFGGPGGLALTPGWTLESNIPNSHFGTSLANAGDVDGDGVADLLIGATGEGAVYLACGSAARSLPTFLPSRILRSVGSADQFGFSVCGIGDVDKDGYADIGVGAYLHTNGEFQEGRVDLYRGTSSGAEATPFWTMESNVVSARFGISMASARDVNADGWPDFTVRARGTGDPGTVHLFQGGGRPTFRRVGQAQAAGIGSLPMGARLAGPANPPALFVVNTVRSPAGRIRARVEVDMATISQRWDEAERRVFGPYDTGAPGDPNAWGSSITPAIDFGALSPGIAYRFRTRNVTRSPYFRASVWAQPRSFEDAGHHFRGAGGSVDVGGPDVATRVRLTAITPSPFRDVATLRFHAPRAGEAALDVFDARGRHVRRLVSGRIDAGDHVAAFDGRDRDGHVVPAGVYFARWSVDGERDTRKLVRLR